MYSDLKKLLKLKDYIYNHLSFIIKIEAFKKKDGYLALIFSTLMVVFEGLGVSILVPILNFIQTEGDLLKFKESSFLSFHLYNFLEIFGLKPNMFLLSFIAIFLISVRQILNYLNQVLVQKISSKVHKEINLKMFHVLMQSSQKYITDLSAGKFINATDIEPGHIANIMKSYFTTYTNILVMIIYSLLLLFTAFLPTLIGVIGFFILVFITGSKFTILIKRLSEKNVHLRSHYRDLIAERFLAWKTIKTFDSLVKEEKKLSDVQSDLYDNTVNITKISSLTQLLFIVVASSVVLITLNILFFKFNAMNVIVFGVAFMRLAPTFKVFQHNISGLVRLLPSTIFCEKIYKESISFSKIDDGTLNRITINKDIKIQNLYFKYLKETKYILNNVSFNLKVGKINAIVGPSGSGKSTLVDLISKIITPNKGEIFFDNNNIKNIKQSSLRKLITYIPQDPFLFKDTIENNIKYGVSRATKFKVWEALRLVKLDKFIKLLPHGLETQVGLLGQTLSGGQKQRLILARAILKNSPVLVLDEATSAIDTKTDNLIKKSLKKIKSTEKKITIIFITHRLSSLLFADHIIEIRNGEIQYEGKPKIQNKNKY